VLKAIRVLVGQVAGAAREIVIEKLIRAGRVE
jgi:hypothetical protein